MRQIKHGVPGQRYPVIVIIVVLVFFTLFSCPAPNQDPVRDPVYYVADSENDRIVMFNDLSGDGWLAFGGPGAGTNEYDAPYGIDTDSRGRIYIAEMENDRIARIDDMTGTNWIAFGTT